MRGEESGKLVSRGLQRHQKNLQLLRNRLRYEIQNIMKLISAAVGDPNFSSISKEKQQEYNAKWKSYNVQLGEIDFE